jgi:hypothetical protein
MGEGYRAHWTPDGSALVIAKQEAPSDIVLFDLADPG